MNDSLGFRSKAELIYERLCSSILDGQIKPGERVNGDALAREYRVSKIPVREAIQKLENQGLVVHSPHAGARIAPLSFREMKGIYMIRASLEGLAARLAATTATGEEFEELGRVHGEMETLFREGNTRGLTQANRKFHAMIARFTRIATLEEMTEATLLKVMRYRVGIHRVAQDWQGVMHEHASILAALVARDPETAERVAKEHVERQLGIELEAQIDTSLFMDDPSVEIAT